MEERVDGRLSILEQVKAWDVAVTAAVCVCECVCVYVCVVLVVV